MKLQFKNFPHTIIIIIFFMVVFAGLTWIIPAGEYQRKEFNGRMVVVSGTYTSIPNQPQGLWAVLKAPIRGFTQAAQIIGFCLLVGGAFGMINKTGAIDAGLSNVIFFSRRKPQYKWFVIPFIMILFSLAGATFGMSESVIVFVIITIPLAISLGYDSIVGIGISFMAAGTGFAGAITNPFNIGVAQGIAEVQLFSGWEYRLLIWFVMTSIAIVFVMIYASKIARKPELSPVYEIDKIRTLNARKPDEEYKFNIHHKIVIVLLFVALALIVTGANRWKWYINEISAIFIALGIVSAAICRLPVKQAIDAFIGGARDLLVAGLVIGFSRGLLVIATDGKIIDTILYAASKLGQGLPAWVSVQVIFFFQSCFTFFVPSGSGQAALTMPVVAPLSDLLGVGRQAAIVAFHLGDGFLSMIVPTSGVTMGVLSIAGIPYQIWIKWFVKLLLIFIAAAMLMLAGAVWFYS